MNSPANAGHAVACLDERGCLTGWNAEAEALFGWTASDALGRSFELLFPTPDARAGVARACLKRAAERGFIEEERWLALRSGATRLCHIALIALPGPLRGFAFAARAADAPTAATTATSDAPAVDATAHEPVPALGHAPRLAGVRLLVVEDSLEVADSIKVLLEFENAAVAVAHDGRQGLAALEAGRYDAVISDVGMPAMDGYEFVRRLRADARFAHLPVIALTGFGQEQDIERALAAGFDTHVVKPVVLDELVAQIRRRLPRKS